MSQKVLYLNDQIKASELKRLEGLKRHREGVTDEAYEQFEQFTLKKFIGWYIQRSLNAQWKMGFNWVREEMRHRDEKSGTISMEAAQLTEAHDLEDPLYQEEEVHDQFKAAQALIRGSGYKSQFAEL